MRRMTPEQLAEEQRCAHEQHMERRVAALTAENGRLRAALSLATMAMRAPLDDWKGEVERKALNAARAVLCEKCGLPPGCPDCSAVHDVGIGA